MTTTAPPSTIDFDPEAFEAHRDARVEQLLERHQVAARLGHVPIAAIALEASTQIRDIDFDPEAVERYAEALDAGAVFPAVLLHDTGDHLVVLGGRHRIEAHRSLGRDTVPAYTVTALDDTVAYILSVEDNATHGLPLTNEERIRHALHLIDHLGLPGDHAARQVGLSRNMVNRAVQRLNGQARADRMMVGALYRTLVPATQSRLMNLASDAVFALTVNAVHTDKINSSEVYELVTRLNETDDPTTQMLILGDFQAEIEAARTKRPGTGPNHAGTLRAVTIKVRSIDPALAVKHCNTRDRSKLSADAREAAMVLLEIAERLAR